MTVAPHASMLYERILITGANGLLGQALVAQFSRLARYDVLATGNNPGPRFQRASCGYVPLDVTQRASVQQIFQDFAPTVVINCAALTDVDRCETNREECWKVNAEAVETLAQRCRKNGARFIQVSTDFVFDGDSGPYGERARPQPVNAYGKAKLAGENAAREAGRDRWTVIRTSVVYGTADGLPRNNFALWVLDELSHGRTIRVFTDQIRTPTYAPDLARCIERIVHFGKTGVYHVSGRDCVSMHAFAHAIAGTFDLDCTLIQPTDSDTLRLKAVRPLHTGLLILKAETEIDYKPRTIQDALTHLRQCRTRPAVTR